MVKRYDSVQALLLRAEKQLTEIQILYSTSLSEKTINPELQPLIKNYLENLRSALDYVAHDIYEGISPSYKEDIKLYFPIRTTKHEFDVLIQKDFATLEARFPEVLDLLERNQPFDIKGRWLEELNKLTNENKHRDLTPQVKKEIPQSLSMSHNGATIKMGRGGSMRIGLGGIVRLGGALIADDQIISVDSTEIRGDPGIKVEKEIWTGFVFSDLDQPVIPLLVEMGEKVRNILTEIYSRITP